MTTVWGRLPARLRLTLWYTAFLAGTQLALGLTGLWLVQHALYDHADELLRSKAAAVQTEVDWARGRLSFDAPRLPEGQMPAVAVGLDLVRIWDRDGRAVFVREGLPGLPPADPTAVQAILNDQQAYDTTHAPDGTAVRLYLEPVRAREGVVGVIQVGRSLDEVEATLDQLRLIGAFGLVAALVLALGGGYFLAGRALAPVDRITRGADPLGAGQPLALAPLDLEELVADVTERIAPRAHERGLEIRTLIEEAGPVLGDATWLTQVLLNLVDNGLRHTAPGGRVTLSLEGAPGGVLLKVADTGEGIAAEHLPHIFERFYRADRARTRVAGGTGLGLAICGWVAGAHHGRLTVESEVGRGTVFSLWLPAARSATGRAPGRPEVTPEIGKGELHARHRSLG